MLRHLTVRLAPTAAICLWMAAGAFRARAQYIGVAPEAGKLRLAVMDLSGSARRIQQTQGAMSQGGVSPRLALRVYEVQPALIDPDTSALDSPDVLIAVLTISSSVCPTATPAPSTARQEPCLES